MKRLNIMPARPGAGRTAFFLPDLITGLFVGEAALAARFVEYIEKGDKSCKAV